MTIDDSGTKNGLFMYLIYVFKSNKTKNILIFVEH